MEGEDEASITRHRTFTSLRLLSTHSLAVASHDGRLQVDTLTSREVFLQVAKASEEEAEAVEEEKEAMGGVGHGILALADATEDATEDEEGVDRPLAVAIRMEVSSPPLTRPIRLTSRQCTTRHQPTTASTWLLLLLLRCIPRATSTMVHRTRTSLTVLRHRQASSLRQAMGILRLLFRRVLRLGRHFLLHLHTSSSLKRTLLHLPSTDHPPTRWRRLCPSSTMADVVEEEVARAILASSAVTVVHKP